VTNQLDCSIGIAKESVYGTAVTVTRHFEYLTESLDYNQTFIQGKGLRKGSRVPRSTRRSVGTISVAGAIGFEAYSRGMGILLEAALGSATATVASGAAFQILAIPGTVADPLPSYTIQKGIPLVPGGAVQAYTFAGMTCNTLELTFDTSSPVMLNTEWIGKDMATATAYATPTYPSSTNGQIWTFVNGAVTMGGTVTAPTTTALATGGTAIANVTAGSVKWSNNLDEGGRYLGGNGKISRQPVIQYTDDSITGSLTFEFTDTVATTAYLAQSDLALVLTFQGSVAIASTFFPTLQVYVPCIRLDGEVPKTNGGNVVSVTSAFHGFDNSVAAQPIYYAYVTADTAV
jgi:hypothetical protein